MEYNNFIVECIIDDLNVTKGHRYEVYQENEKYYWIKKNRYGASSFYPKEWFKKIEENNELNIIEASNMPCGTEFKILYQNGNIDNWKCKVTGSGTCNVLSWIHNDESIGGTQSIINAKFIPIKQKPVSFMDVVKSKEDCRVEHPILDIVVATEEDNSYYYEFNNKGYLPLNCLLHILGGNLGVKEVKKVILEGKWYLEK